MYCDFHVLLSNILKIPSVGMPWAWFYSALCHRAFAIEHHVCWLGIFKIFPLPLPKHFLLSNASCFLFLFLFLFYFFRGGFHLVMSLFWGYCFIDRFCSDFPRLSTKPFLLFLIGMNDWPINIQVPKYSRLENPPTLWENEDHVFKNHSLLTLWTSYGFPLFPNYSLLKM